MLVTGVLRGWCSIDLYFVDEVVGVCAGCADLS